MTRRSGTTGFAPFSIWRDTSATTERASLRFTFISKELRKRFLQRIDEPEKNWKFSLADVAARKFRKQYVTAHPEIDRRTRP